MGRWTDSSCCLVGDYNFLIWLATTCQMIEISASLGANEFRQHLAHETPISRLRFHIRLLSLTDWKFIDSPIPGKKDPFPVFF